MKKLPPIEKIYEAYSAIADSRVMLGENEATVTSSSYEKQYIVTWQDNIYTSSDSATYWQGYAGYPILAVLMLQGRLTLNRDIARYFKNINWTQLNSKHKSDYAGAVDEVLSALGDKNTIRDAILKEVQAVYDQLAVLELVIKRGKHRPPKSNSEKKQ